ncbi:hypothetical protein Tco_1421697 [Tanacetum coccineum]
MSSLTNEESTNMSAVDSLSVKGSVCRVHAVAAALVLVVVHGGTNELKKKYTSTMRPTAQNAAATKNRAAGRPVERSSGGGRRHCRERDG